MKASPTRQIIKPEFIDASNVRGKRRLETLRSKSQIIIHDLIESQIYELVKIRHPEHPSSTKSEYLLERVDEYLAWHKEADAIGNWVYYDWNNRLVHVLGKDEFTELRTNRNKLKINDEEQQLLANKKVGIAGLSVGRSIAITLAMERSVGEFRLADFDNLELSNLNRINAPLCELGLNKAIAAARNILDIDPYLKVIVYTDGLNEQNMESFFKEDGVIDLFIEECDGLDIKILSRHFARKNGIPVFMEASDRCLIDVERFDEEPDRPILHGLVPDLDPVHLKTLKTDEEKLPYLVKIVGLDTLSVRMKASMLEIQQTLTSWPQLASDVTLGGGIGGEIVRNILLKRLTGSGRFHLDPYSKVPLRKIEPYGRYTAYVNQRKHIPTSRLTQEQIEQEIKRIKPKHSDHHIEIDDISDLQEAAHLAPSGGNIQPWIWIFRPEAVYLFLDPSKTNTYLDKNKRASLIALGCSICNFTAKAEELGYKVRLSYSTPNKCAVATLRLVRKSYFRETNYISEYLYTRNTYRTVSNTNKLRNTSFHLSFIKHSHLNLKLFEESKVPDILIQDILHHEMKRNKNHQGHYDFYQELAFDPSSSYYSRSQIDLQPKSLTSAEISGILLLNDTQVSDHNPKINQLKSSRKIISRVLSNPIRIGFITLKKSPPHNEYLETGIFLQQYWNSLHSEYFSLQPVSPISLTKDIYLDNEKILFIFTIHTYSPNFTEQSLRHQ